MDDILNRHVMAYVLKEISRCMYIFVTQYT